MSINNNLFNSRGVWILQDRNHEGISIRRYSDRDYVISGWAEIWDDLWSWKASITLEELELLSSDSSNASTTARNIILQSERTWFVEPPYSVPKKPYTKEGYLSWDDGFRDGGTGRGW